MDTTYGAMFIGDDPVGIKALVAGVWILDVEDLVVISQTCYHYLTTGWGNNAALLVSTQPRDLHLILVGIATAYLRDETSFDRTTFVIGRLIQYTVTTGLATSALAVGCLIAYLARPHTFILIAMHLSLGRMYTNALGLIERGAEGKKDSKGLGNV
ncbi:hypothetical protein FB451DRAFT_1391993 [Mycena latifolia]|nr:hypothetical protein FB451DRAFT_1391993 [Mycena latifolia]